jgi:hypothetical protein
MAGSLTINRGDINNPYFILYPKLARNFDDAAEFPPEEANYLQQAKINVVDSTGNIDEKTLIEVSLLEKINIAFKHSKDYYYSNSRSPYILISVRAINDIVINNANWTSDDVLRDFVNDIDWEGDCVFNWATLSDEAGYDTSEWNICS